MTALGRGYDRCNHDSRRATAQSQERLARHPQNKLVVLTGLSGSGKSTLAFDTLHKEGQRQYMESLGLVTMRLSKPPVDAIVGLSPSISVDSI